MYAKANEALWEVVVFGIGGVEDLEVESRGGCFGVCEDTAVGLVFLLWIWGRRRENEPVSQKQDAYEQGVCGIKVEVAKLDWLINGKGQVD